MEADVAVYVFWLWLAISFLVLAVQVVRRLRYRRMMRRREAESVAARRSSAAGTTEQASAEPVTAPPLTTALPPEPTLSAEAALPSQDALNPEPAPSSEPAPSVPTQAPAAEASAADEPAAPPIIDLAGEPVIETEPAARRRSATVAGLLSGIQLPGDLLPAATDDDGLAVRLASAERDAADVGTALADELERNGFAIEAIGDDRAAARRDGEVLSLQIRPLDTGAEIDVWVGEGANPLLSNSRC